MADATWSVDQATAGDPQHDAFISYSRADRAFAAALESALERYRPPRSLGLAYRYLRVFRDEEDFTGTEYKSAVQRHLRQSRKLIVVCSPASRASEYVAEEIRLFVEARGAANIIPILLSGVANNEAKPGGEAELAFPDALCDVMAMPLAVSYLGYSPTEHRIRRAPFEGAWLTVLANLYEIERSELEQRERRRQLRSRRLWTTSAAALILALSSLTVWALFSRQEAIHQRQAAELATAKEKIATEEQRKATNEAERQRQIAVTRQLAAQAELTINQEPNRLPKAVLLAVESLHPDHGSTALEGYEALRHGLSLLPPRPVQLIQSGPSRSLAMSPDGGFFATLSWLDEKILVTLFANTDTPKIVDELKDATVPAIEAIAVAPGGRRVALVRARGVDIWEPQSGRAPTVVLMSKTPGASDVRFSPDGRFLALVSRQGGFTQVWTADGPARSWPGDPVTALGFAMDGTLSLIGRSAIAGWEFGSGTRFQRCQLGATRMAVFSPDAGYAALLDDARTVHVVQLPESRTSPCREFARIAVQQGVTALALSTDGRTLAIGSSDGMARVWSLAEGRELAWMTHTAGVVSLGFDGSGARLVTTDAGGAVRVWKVARNTELLDLAHPDEVSAVAFGSGMSTLTTVTTTGAIRSWDFASAKPGTVRPVHDAFETSDDGRGSFIIAPEVLQVAFSPGGAFLAMLTSDDELLVWDLKTGRQRRSQDIPAGEVTQLSMSDDGTLAAALMNDETVVLVRPGQRAVPDRAVGKRTNAVAFGSPGQRLATIDAGGKLTLRRPGDWEVTTSLSAAGDAGPILWSPNGQFLAAVGQQHVARVWDLRNGQVIGQLPLEQKGEPRALSPDGAFIATIIGSRASVWELKTGSEIARLTHGGAVNDLAFSHDGRLLATASADLRARIWLWHPKDLVAAACARLTISELDAADWQTYLGSEPRRSTCPPAVNAHAK